MLDIDDGTAKDEILLYCTVDAGIAILLGSISSSGRSDISIFSRENDGNMTTVEHAYITSSEIHRILYCSTKLVAFNVSDDRRSPSS